ncbi:hypothetical protein JCM10450v2_002744 [Rhodotorula kratochvilovae]
MALSHRLFLVLSLALWAKEITAGAKKNRKITVTNQCTFTVWPGLFTSVGPQPAQDTGWEAAPGSTLTFEVEESWGGRVWPRTGCDFSDASKPDYAQCETGGCKGGLKCDPAAGTGVLPVTLAEFNIQTEVDHYDTSNVDGYNVGLAITNSADCPLSNCPYNLLTSCPDELQYNNDAGDVVGCLTACGKWQTNEEYCCSGAHSTPDKCPPSGVKYYDWWKEACPIAYAYAYDESSGTALFTCTKQVDWVITFCPDSSLFETTAKLPNGTEITQGDGYELFPTAAVSITGTADGGGGGVATATATGGSATGGGTSPSGETTAAPTGAATTGGAGAATSGGGASGGGAGGAASKTSTSAASGSTGGSGSLGSSGTGSSGSASSSSSSDDDTLFGMPKMAVYAIIGIVALLLLGAIAYFVFASKKKDAGGKKEHSRHDSDDSPSSDASSSTGSGSGSDDEDEKPRKKRHSHKGDDDDNYSLAKLDAIGRAERRAVDRSVYSVAARDPAGLRGVLAREEAERTPRTTFELAKGATSSSGESDAGERLLRRSRRGRQAYEG